MTASAEYQRAWRIANPGKTSEYRRAWREANPETAEQKAERNRKLRETKRSLAAHVNALKTSKGCTDCGYSSHAAALHFDHLPGFKKSFNIGRAVANKLPLRRILEEVEKCEVVCANCHQVRTDDRRT